MAAPTYNWKRFWCPRESPYSLADGGYLSDPDSAWGKAANPDVKTFAEIAHIPCLALLGEPGIGKSRAMQWEQEASSGQPGSSEDTILTVDLRSVGSEQRFMHKVFESALFRTWANGSHRLHLFLDSLDECLLRV